MPNIFANKSSIITFTIFVLCCVSKISAASIVVDQHCTAIVSAWSGLPSPNAKTKFSEKNGITFDGLGYLVTLSPSDDCSAMREACFTELEKHYEQLTTGRSQLLQNLPTTSGASIKWKDYLCKILGPKFSGNLRIEMRYACWNEKKGEQVESTRFVLTVDHNATPPIQSKNFEKLVCP